ncbi:MAG: hypothetical protein ACRD3E_20005 [Terriglobales bacterium]
MTSFTDLRPATYLIAIVDGEVVRDALFGIDVVMSAGAHLLGGNSPFAPETKQNVFGFLRHTHPLLNAYYGGMPDGERWRG